MKPSLKHKIIAYSAILGFVFSPFLVFASSCRDTGSGIICALDMFSDLPDDVQMYNFFDDEWDYVDHIYGDVTKDKTVIAMISSPNLTVGTMPYPVCVDDSYTVDSEVGPILINNQYADVFSGYVYFHCPAGYYLSIGNDASQSPGEYQNVIVYYVDYDTRDQTSLKESGSVIFGIAIIIFLLSMFLMGLLFKIRGYE